jgi:assimilatory nitrate reductase catalytic subunit
VTVPQGWLVELAGVRDPGPLVESLLPKGERLVSLDAARGVRRSAVLKGGTLQAAIYLTRSGLLPDRDWVIAQLVKCEASPVELLAGRSATPAPDRGAIVCVCFDVGAKTISAAAHGGAATIEAVGKTTCAGTNCGSCRPAIAKLLEQALAVTLEAAQ